eukprot:scaffold22.g6045.t1
MRPGHAAEGDRGVDTRSLDRFDCTGHWASSGCVRALAAEGSAARAGGLALLPAAAFAALWETDPAAPAGWRVPYSSLHYLEEAYGGLCRELKALGFDLSRAHYMLRGWQTREGRPRHGDGNRRGGAGAGAGRGARGLVPREIVATRHLRAMICWPGLLELLEAEGVAVVPTAGARYWLARVGQGYQRTLAAAGIVCREQSVHHIVARSNRGIDHPLNYFIIDRGDNSAMGNKLEGFRDAEGNKLHMRDIVGELAFEVALAACNLYHGLLYAGRARGAPLEETLRELREAAFHLAHEAIEGRPTKAAAEAAAAAGAEAARGGRRGSTGLKRGRRGMRTRQSAEVGKEEEEEDGEEEHAEENSPGNCAKQQRRPLLALQQYRYGAAPPPPLPAAQAAAAPTAEPAVEGVGMEAAGTACDAGAADDAAGAEGDAGVEAEAVEGAGAAALEDILHASQQRHLCEEQQQQQLHHLQQQQQPCAGEARLREGHTGLKGLRARLAAALASAG